MINIFNNTVIFQNEKHVWAMLLVFASIFFIGLIGIVTRRANFLITLLCIEIMYLSIICYSSIASLLTLNGSHISLLILISAACESAIGLGILIVLNNYGKSILYSSYEIFKG